MLEKAKSVELSTTLFMIFKNPTNTTDCKDLEREFDTTILSYRPKNITISKRKFDVLNLKTRFEKKFQTAER